MTSDSPPSASQAPCPHFGDCGGCRHQDLPYAEQLLQKATALKQLLGSYWPAPIQVVPSPDIWHYRNKVEFNFDLKMYDQPPPRDFQRENVIGFKRQGKWFWTLDLETCLIAPPGCAELLQSIRLWMTEQGLRAQHKQQSGGCLRHLIVRATARTNERMVVLITSSEQPIDGESFVAAVRRAYPADSIYHGIYNGRADAAYADELHHLYGNTCITERLLIPAGDTTTRSLEFIISPFAFFQVNPPATELLYGQLRQWIAQLAPAQLLDLYGGSGAIAFTVADLVPTIVSVEEVEAATRDGMINALLNDIPNVEFKTADVRRYLEAFREGRQPWPDDATVVVDPPRAGLHPKVISHLLTLLPQHLIYVSCNPKLLARELPRIAAFYDIADLRAFDLFPHTPHVECALRLVRKTESI